MKFTKKEIKIMKDRGFISLGEYKNRVGLIKTNPHASDFFLFYDLEKNKFLLEDIRGNIDYNDENIDSVPKEIDMVMIESTDIKFMDYVVDDE